MEIIFQTSLIASFVAGMVALFAPCCITFLLPAYLGSVFKEKEKILLMTIVFGLGIAVTLLPAVLGVALISKLLFRYHNLIYIIGGIVLVVVAIITFLGIKPPIMVSLGGRAQGKSDPLSIFVLGIFSGITSACCAPVLIGILALTLLSPSFFGALLIGAMYVLGMITPLLLISMFLAGKIPKLQILRRNLATIDLFGKKYFIGMTNLIASIIFFLTGWLILILTLSGRLSMGSVEVFAKTIQNSADLVDKYVGNNWIINIGFLIALVFFLYKLLKSK